MIADYSRHKTCIFGIQESGKTFFAKNEVLSKFKKPIVFVVNKDDGWDKIKKAYVVQCENRLNVQNDFLNFIRGAYRLAMQGKIVAIFIDEAVLFIHSNWDICPELSDLILNHRHIPENTGVALVFMTRRPQDIPTKIVESSKNLVIFSLEGANAIRRFNEIHPQIPELIEKLDYEKHNFVFKTIGKPPVIMDAIKP